MMDITVKTLDGQNRTYSIPEKMTVKEFKGKIANSINIQADVQRLIFQGRVMQDDKLLKDYDVHGKVIHVVQRMPPSARATTTTGGATSTTSTPPGGATARDMNRILIGSFNLPSGALDPNNVQNVVQQAVTSMGEMGRNARVSTSVSNDGASLDVQIHLGQIPGATESESQLRINHARRMLGLAREKLNRLERGEGDNQEQSASSRQAAETSTSPMDTTEEEQTPSTSASQETASSATASTSAQSETATQSEEVPSTSQSNATSANQPSGNNNQTGEQNQPRGPIRPNVSVVADVLDEVHEVNRRLQPFLERYQQIVRDDTQLSPEETRQQQSVCGLVSEILHTISHCYHSLSDLLVDFTEPPPRQLYTAIVPVPLAVPTAVIQQTIPVHAQINVGGSPRLVQRNMGTQSTVPTSTQSTTTSQASANVASQTPPTQSTGTGTTGASAEPVTTGATNGTTPTPTTTSDGTPTVTRASTDPYVFLEVGPDHAVTVNSITAHVISSESEVPSTSAASTGSTTTGPQGAPNNLTADLLQNIVSSVMQAHADPRVGMMHTVSIGTNRQNRHNNMSRSSAAAQAGGAQATPVTNSSGTQTTSSTNAASHSGTQTTNTATNSSGTQTGAGPRTAAFIMPGLPGAVPGLGQGIPGLGAGIPGLGSGIPRIPGSPTPLDPFLQCNSRHFLRERAAQSQSQNGSRSARSNQSTRQEFTGGRPEALADMMINLISEMHPHLQGERPTAGAPSTTNSTTTSTTGGATATTGTTGTNSSNSTQQTSRPATSSSTSTAAGSTTTTTTSSAGIPPPINPFAGMIQNMSGMIQGMMGAQPGGAAPQMPMPVPMPGLAAMFGQMAQGMQGLRPPTAAGSRPATGTTTTSSGAQPEPAFVNELRNLLQTGSNPPTNSTTTTTTTSTSSSSTSSTGESGGPPNSAMTDEAFTQLVQGIGNMVTQTALGNPPSQSISDFLTDLGENYSISSSGGFFNDIFHCVSTQLTFPDLIQVFYGNRQPLNRVRVPLQEFIRERVLQNEEYTLENTERGVDRLMQEMMEEVQAVENISEVKPGIDLTATLTGFLRKQMLAVCRMIMNSDDTNTNFGGHFYEKVRRILAELLILTRSCLVGGQPALEQLIQNRLTFITAGVNPMIQQWMVAVTTQQVNQFLPTITVQEQAVSHYIIRTSEKKKVEDKKKPEKKEDVASTSSSPMDTSSPVTSLGAAQLDSPEAMDVENGAEEAVVSSSSDVQKPKPSEAAKDNVKVKVNENARNGSLAESPGAAAGSVTWQAEVPQEWVPIITNDVEKQKHQRPQQPLSDTYLQGMPAKRRKLMSHDGQMNLSNAAQTVPESIRRAVAAAGVEPISSVENLTSEATDNKELEQAFDEQVASSISDRLDSDTDYKAERFPNTEQYCRKNKK